LQEGDAEKEGQQVPRSLSFAEDEEPLGPILISIPLLLSKKSLETYAALDPIEESILSQHPSAADLIADEYFDANLADGLDPVRHEELELGSHVTSPLSTESVFLPEENLYETSTG